MLGKKSRVVTTPPVVLLGLRLFNILAIYVAISANIGLFSENAYYRRILYMRARPPRAQDISTKIDPIDLKFGGVIYLHITTKMAHFIRNWSLFSLYFLPKLIGFQRLNSKKTRKKKSRKHAIDLIFYI